MEHPDDIELIELAGGRLAPERRGAVEAHVAVCAACRERLEAGGEVWQALGAWEVTPPACELAAAVQAAARRGARERAPGSQRRRRLVAALRIAAAVALGAGAGHLAARAVRARAGREAAVEAREAVVAEALRLTVLEQAAPAGVADAVLGVEPTGEEEAL